MAVSLALLTGAVWTVLALTALVWRQRRSETPWDLWDALRGVRVPGGLRGISDWLVGLELLGEGYRLGLRANTAGDGHSGSNLMRAELASAQSLLEQLELDLAECRRQSRVLQAVTDVAPLDSGAPRSRSLRRLWALERGLHAVSGSPLRLRLRIMALRVSVGLVRRRLIGATRRSGYVEGDTVNQITADVTALTLAVAVSRNALVSAWDASRSRLGFDDPSPTDVRTTHRHLM